MNEKIKTNKELEVNRDTGFYHKYAILPNGLQAHYVEGGPEDAPVLLMTHGFLGSWRDWRANLVALATDPHQPRRVIALDWAGFGESSKPHEGYSLFFFADFLRQFVNTLGLKEFDLLGHSMGGKYNLAFSILHPGYVRSLILVSNDGFSKDPWWASHTRTPLVRGLISQSIKMFGTPGFIRSNWKNVFFDPRYYPSEAEIEKTAKALRDPEQRAALQAMSVNYPALSMTTIGLDSRLPEMKCPILIVWGKNDRFMPVENAYRFRKLFSNSQLYIFDHCGHMPQLEKFSKFNHVVLKFLGELDYRNQHKSVA